MNSVLIVSGEDSGERYGARLVHQFKKRHPSTSFFGIGGAEMEAEGVELIFPVKELAVLGIFEIVSHLPRIRRIFEQLKKEIRQRRPKAAVLIDSPDFNLRLAKFLKKLSVPVLYYISPTIWAWRKSRLNSIKKNVKKMMLIFPFEEKIYGEKNIPAVYVGHPLLEEIRVSLSREDFCRQHNFDPQKKLIALLPGSRKNEIRFHMPVLVKSIECISHDYDVQFVLLLAKNLAKELVASYIPSGFSNLTVLNTHYYDALSLSDLAISCCGTANLEAALVSTPLIAFYRLSSLTYSLGVRFVKIKNYSIVNILAGKQVIPELIQQSFSPENIYKESARLLSSEKAKTDMICAFEKIKNLLGNKRASEQVASELECLLTGAA